MKQLFAIGVYLFKLLPRKRFVPFSFGATVVMSIASGVCAAMLVSLIGVYIGGGSQNHSSMARMFALLLGTRVVLRFVAQYLAIRLGQKAVLQTRFSLCDRIVNAPLRHVEELGVARLTAALTADLGQISQALVTMPQLFVNVTMLLAFILYLAWMSPWLVLEMAVVTAAGLLTVRPFMRVVQGKYQRSRAIYDELASYFRALIEGAKELRMHASRRGDFISSLQTTAWAHQRQARSADIILAGTAGWIELLFFLTVALILFVPHGGAMGGFLAAYVVTVLMMRAPLDSIVTSIPVFSQATVAIDKLESISNSVVQTSIVPPRPADAPNRERFSELELKHVQLRYGSKATQESFVLGPVNLIFKPGEIVFVIGGNGSGKTTLAKTLAGLYSPESGQVRLNGVVISEDHLDWYREQFTVVFSDSFLFEKLFGLETVGETQAARACLERLALADLVKIDKGVLSTLQLSQGQRKRISLFVAYLEDREIFIFDEWAADQDPRFKKVFYQTLLPELRAKGRTVIVITHDDSYYSVADRIVKLNSGQIEFDGSIHEYMATFPMAGSAVALTSSM
jgi:putative pyoverdin transport system ATP-binding/permease protein